MKRGVLDAWIKAQAEVPALRKGLITAEQLKEESARFLKLFTKAVAGENFEDVTAPEYDEVNKFLAGLSVSRAVLGFSASETATYIFSLKDTLLGFLQKDFGDRPEVLNQMVIRCSKLMDKLGLLTFEAHTKGREEVILEQQKSLLELSTPVIQVWEEILILPLIGSIDSARALQIMENLLESIVKTESSVVIIDITGVPTVDTEVANRLMGTMQAAKLLGAQCILTGLSPQISQAIVHLGGDLAGDITRATLKNGLEVALSKLNFKVTKTGG